MGCFGTLGRSSPTEMQVRACRRPSRTLQGWPCIVATTIHGRRDRVAYGCLGELLGTDWWSPCQATQSAVRFDSGTAEACVHVRQQPRQSYLAGCRADPLQATVVTWLRARRSWSVVDENSSTGTVSLSGACSQDHLSASKSTCRGRARHASTTDPAATRIFTAVLLPAANRGVWACLFCYDFRASM